MKKIGLSVLLFGYLFWYGLGYLNPLAGSIFTLSEANILIGVFPLLMIVGHKVGYIGSIDASSLHVGHPVYVLGQRSFIMVVTSAVLFTGILVLYSGRGMIGYHSLRAEVAVGILVLVFCYIFNGRKRAVLILIFVAISIYCLGTYSRRPFLTLVAPIFLVPLIRKRFQFSKRLVFGVSVICASVVGLLYVTGIRALDYYSFPFDVVVLLQQGLMIFLQGEGFDTVLLTEFVVEQYDASGYLYGSSFLGGVVNFIPRAIWPEKPIAFGIILSAEYFGVSIDETFTNFGPGIVAEAYSNGGFIAILIVSTFLGIVVGWVDRQIEKKRFDWNWVLFGSVFYPALFFMIRGDFLNSFYELYSKALVIWAVVSITGVRRRLRPVIEPPGTPAVPGVLARQRPMRLHPRPETAEDTDKL